MEADDPLDFNQGPGQLRAEVCLALEPLRAPFILRAGKTRLPRLKFSPLLLFFRYIKLDIRLSS